MTRMKNNNSEKIKYYRGKRKDRGKLEKKKSGKKIVRERDKKKGRKTSLEKKVEGRDQTK